MSLKPVAVGFLAAAAFWFFMFSPLTAGTVNFWLAMTLATGTLTAWALGNDRHELRALYAFKPGWILTGLVSAGILYLLFFTGDRISSLLFDFSKPQVAGIYSTRSQASPALIGTLLLLWIGPAEEIFWRGFAQRRMAAKYGQWWGYFLTTAVYALIHIWALNFMLFMASLICGLFWGWMYVKYRSVWPGLISHGVWDLVIFVLFPIQ
ncbi:MAG: CPBP family intramembrane metalloprotease [bacterium]|nr:MAG: CPBP family intramembrane metalloprotease [bacterium]